VTCAFWDIDSAEWMRCNSAPTLRVQMALSARPPAHDAVVSLLPGCDCFVVVGERSGDAYGGAIVRELLRRRPDTLVAAMGGQALAAAGAEIEEPIAGLGVVGFWPVLRHLRRFLALRRRLLRIIRARQPRVVLTIDYPGFNFQLLRGLAGLRASGTRFVHVVAPQVWAWRHRRAKRIAQSIDRLLCFFPFEPALFTRFGGSADFVGHPLADLVPARPATTGVEAELGLRPQDHLLLLAPGSREREVGQLLPILDAAARAALPELAAGPGGKVRVAVSRAGDLPRELYRSLTDFPLVDGDYHGLCARARVGVIASGTATLEAALIGLPTIIVYRGDAATAAIIRRLIRSEHVGLPNIVHERRVCPELLQDELDGARLAERIRALWGEQRQQQCRAALGLTRGLLGAGGAMQRIAGIVADELEPSAGREDAPRGE